MTDSTPFDHMVVLGIGLIGSSLAHAARANGLASRITGYDLSPDVCSEATELGVVDEATTDLSLAVTGADFLVLSVPVGAMAGVLGQLSECAEPGAIIMDVGSVKQSVCNAAEGLPEGLHMVPAHPVAGTEKSGPSAGFATLFRNRWCILTPLERSDPAYRHSVDRVEAFWQAIGSDVTRMEAGHHDLALAVTSHLPHLIAYTLVGAADDIENVSEGEVVKYSAGGFRDFTRIAASDPVMWRDVFLHNKDAVLEVLGRFSEELAVMQRAIRWGDGAALEKAFQRSRALRRAIVDAGQDSAEANFGRDQ